MRVMRLLTEGGILLLAMQRYAPICSREMSCKSLHICDMSCDMQYNFQYVVWGDTICSHKRQKKREERTCRSRYSPRWTELSIGLGFVLCESRKIGLPSSRRQVIFG